MCMYAEHQGVKRDEPREKDTLKKGENGRQRLSSKKK